MEQVQVQGAGVLFASVQVRSRERTEGDGDAIVMGRRDVRTRMVGARCIVRCSVEGW